MAFQCPDQGTGAPPSGYQIDISCVPHITTAGKVQIIMTIAFTIIGALSLLMTAIAGLRYIASQGDPQAVAKAKGTLIYSLVGLLVSISAVAIVTFVIGRV